MTTPPGIDADGAFYVSTGHLPPPDQIKALVAEAHGRYKTNTDG
jgi:glutaminase